MANRSSFLKLTAWFAVMFLGWGALFGMIMKQRLDAEQFLARSAQTKGQILSAHYSKPSWNVEYVYSVGGSQFRATDSAMGLHDLERGRQVTVYYVPGTPSMSHIDPQGSIDASNGMIPFVGAIGAILALIYVLLWVSNRYERLRIDRGRTG